MVDVISATIGTMHADTIGPGWELGSLDLTAWSINPITHGSCARKWVTVQDKGTGLRISGPKDWGPLDIEVSMPRLFWVDNGRLIRGQEQIDDASELITQLLKMVSPSSVFSIVKIKHIELPWHFSGSPVEWVPYYSGMKYPRIEAFPVAWRDEFLTDEFSINPVVGSNLRLDPAAVGFSPTAVSWLGDMLKISLYDKTAERRLSAELSPVMRLEFTLRDRLAIGLIDPNGRLVFDRLYNRYRELAGAFRDFSVSRSVYGSPQDFLVSLHARGLIPEHEYRLFISTKARATQFRYLRHARCHVETWELAPGIITRLPEGEPPDAPDVVAPDQGQSTSTE